MPVSRRMGTSFRSSADPGEDRGRKGPFKSKKDADLYIAFAEKTADTKRNAQLYVAFAEKKDK